MAKRNTIQRTLVLDAVQQLKSHATADEIYKVVLQEHPNISKATVYRNLRQLADDGEIRALEVPGGAERFDHLNYPHYHIKCTRCGKYFDVDMDYDEELPKRIKNKAGFEVTGHDIIFQGLCPACKEA